MCIIAYKPADAGAIKKEILKQCWDNNQDGAGIAHFDGELWQVVKGLMTWKSFWKTYNQFQFGKGDTVIVHFRVGTSGKNKKGCTHPFPICDDYKKMNKTQFEAENIAFHNGVLSQGDGDASDSQEWVKYYIDPLLPYIEDEKIEGLLNKVLGTDDDTCRWVIATPQSVWLLGDWVDDKETGWSFSNKFYKTAKTGTWKTTGVGGTTTYHYPTYTPANTASKYDSVLTNKDTDEVLSGSCDNNGLITWDTTKITNETLAAIDDFAICPSCFNQETIDISPFEDGSTHICYECGKAFDVLSGRVTMTDPDIVAKTQKKSEVK